MKKKFHKDLHKAFFTACTAIAIAPLQTYAQNIPDPAPEQRRQQERERQERQRQEPDVDVRPNAKATPIADRLPEGESPCFVVREIHLQSAQPSDSLVPFNGLLDALGGLDADDRPLGHCLGAKGIALVLKRAQDALIAKGFVTTRVLAQAQDLSSSKLVLTVVPGRIRAVRMATPNDGRGTLWNAVPAKPGDLLNLRDIEQGLENFKRVPTAEADIRIEPADTPDQSDLVVSYKQAVPFRLSLSVDDSGSPSTGKFQGGVTFSYDNWWTLNDLFYITLNHNLGGGVNGGGGDAGPRGTQGNIVHYSIPLGYWTLGATASNSKYHQTVAGASQDYVYSGTSSNSEIKLTRLVYRDAVRKTSISLKGWQRLSNNFIDDTEIQVQRRVVAGWELGITHKEAWGQATLDTSITYKRGTGAFGSLPAPEEAFGEGSSRFGLISTDTTLNQPFKLGAQSFKYTGNWRTQRNTTPVTPQDRFAIGGRYTVRGYDGQSSLVGERGWLVRNDISMPLGDSGASLYLGLDHGEVGGPSSDQLVDQRLTGSVVGLRGSLQQLQYDFFLGSPVRKPSNLRSAGSTAGFSLNYTY